MPRRRFHLYKMALLLSIQELLCVVIVFLIHRAVPNRLGLRRMLMKALRVFGY